MIYAVNKRTKEHREYLRCDPIGEDEQLVHGDCDGWIPWEGGECPLPRGTFCDYRYRDGRVVTNLRAGSLTWAPKPEGAGKTAYRPILDAKPEGEPEAPEWDGGLPPEGIECEVELESNEWQWCEIKAHRGSGSWIVTSIKDRVIRNDLVRFRPIRSEEEKQIEAIAKATGLRGRDGKDEVARNLYAAGCRMTKQ